MCQRPPATAAACLLRPPSVRSVATCFSVSHRSQPSALSNQPEPMICACFSTSLLSCLLVLNRQSIHSYPNLPTDTHATQQRNVWCLFVISVRLVCCCFIHDALDILQWQRRRRKCWCTLYKERTAYIDCIQSKTGQINKTN